MTIDRSDERTSTPERGPGTLVQLAYAACGAVTWAAALNLAWFVGTLLGGVVLGAGPATAAAYTLSRRRARGEGIRFVRDFWAVYRAEWRSANIVFAPVVIAWASLAFTWSYAMESHAGWPFFAALILGSAIVVGTSGVLAPMYVHYTLPRRRYIVMALRFTLAMPWTLVLVVALTAVIALATALLPALFWFLSIGAWISLDLALCLALFAANEARLADTEAGTAA